MPIRPISDTLAAQRDGRMLEELSQEYNELIRQVQKTNKKGTITLKLTVDPVKQDAYRVFITDKITVSAPEEAKSPSLFYTTPDGNTQRRDPNQKDIMESLEVHEGGAAQEIPDNHDEANEVG